MRPPRLFVYTAPLLMPLLLLLACVNGATDPIDALGDARGDLDLVDLGELPPRAVRLALPGGAQEVLCNGRLLSGTPTPEGLVVDLDAVAQGWDTGVVLCQAVEDDPLFAPMVVLAFKDGLLVWAPNLSLAGEVRADVDATAIASAFLSPLLATSVPETARALLEQCARSPYLAALTAAVQARDEIGAGESLGPLLTDVLAQVAAQETVSSALTAERPLGMTHLNLTHTGSYLSIESELGTSVDHLCAVYALEACALDSAGAFAAVEAADAFPKEELARVYVPSKSWFKYLDVVQMAVVALVDSITPDDDQAEGEMVHLTPGRVHDIQCYSGAVGGDDEDRAADEALMASEPDAQELKNLARVANVVTVATDLLALLVDFDAFGSGGGYLIAETIARCTRDAVGPTLALSDGATTEELIDLVGNIQGCAVRELIKGAARLGLYAVAKWAFDWVPGPGYLARISSAGQALDRVVGMLLVFSPLERALIADDVDFDACHPCEDDCAADGEATCVDGAHFQRCGQHDEDECLDWSAPTFCGGGYVCVAPGSCVACGAVGEPCCATGTCDSGNACQGEVCIAGCAEECPAVGLKECLSSATWRSCGEHDGDACLEWSPVEACPDGTVCVGGVCELPACEDDCALGELRCGPDGVVESCGECDDDACRDWCAQGACEAHFDCVDGACACGIADEDLPGVAPGAAQPALDDVGTSWTVEDALWPEGDADVLSGYVTDTVSGTIKPTAAVSSVGEGLVYDLCIAWACDPAENGGEPTDVTCEDAIKTTRDGRPACCLLSQTGDRAVAIDAECTLFGAGNDSGTAYVYLESVEGEQCWPRVRVTLTGGKD